MTMHYDVFNGDADGIISLLQLRFYQPTESQLVTGVKRDIQLLDQLNIEPGDSSIVSRMAPTTLQISGSSAADLPSE